MTQYALFLLRAVSGFLFCLHGTQKLFGALGGMNGHGAAAAFPGLLWFAAVLEFAGGLMIVVGFITRPVAFILCGEMAVAYFTAHFPKGFWPVKNGGELAVLYCFIFLYLFTAGPGALSLDGLRRHRKRR